MADIDIVSDLIDDTVSVNQGNVPADRGSDVPSGEKAPAPRKVDTQEKPAGEKPASLRDQISSALKGDDLTPPAASLDGTQPRGPDGKFAPKEGEVLAPVDAVQPPAAAPVAVPNGIDPQVFNALPAETQASLARTMETMNERASRLAGYEHIEQLIAPRRQPWALNGMTEAQAVGQLFALSDFASSDPSGFIKYFAQQSGVNLEDVVFGDPDDTADPAVQALKQQVERLKGQLQGYDTQQQQTAHNQRVDSIVQFATEKGADGQPLRPYMEELGQEILPFITAVMQQNKNWSQGQILQEAYDRACWGTPTVRKRMQDAAAVASDATRIREQQTKVHNARSAGASVPSGVPTAPPASPADGSMGLRDTIKASMNAAT